MFSKYVVFSLIASCAYWTDAMATGCALKAGANLPQNITLFQTESKTVALYTSQLRRDDDGAANAYHPCGANFPDDRCTKGFGLDHICSGVDVRDAAGNHVPPSEPIRRGNKIVHSSKRCLDTFRAAADANFPNCRRSKLCVTGWPGLVLVDRDAGPSLANRVPAVRPDGTPYAGYYVSQTTLGRPDETIIGNTSYLDARFVPYVVVPGSSALTAAPWSFGSATRADLAVVIEPQPNGNARAVFAVVGDTGPAKETGEASVALLARLQAAPEAELKSERPTTSALPNTIFLKRPTIILFHHASHFLDQAWPAHDLTAKAIAMAGRKALESIGGFGAVAGCGSIPSDPKDIHIADD